MNCTVIVRKVMSRWKTTARDKQNFGTEETKKNTLDLKTIYKSTTKPMAASKFECLFCIPRHKHTVRRVYIWWLGTNRYFRINSRTTYYITLYGCPSTDEATLKNTGKYVFAIPG